MPDAAAIDTLLRRVRPGVVRLVSSHGAGTGTVLGRRDFFVTNAHVAGAGATAATNAGITVVASEGQRVEAAIVASDPDRDLALFRAPGLDAEPLALARDVVTRPGQIVVAVGFPDGDAVSARAGVVASRAADDRGGRTLVVSDLRLAPGFSGGPMVDAEGRVAAISTLIVGALGAGVSAATVRRFLADVAAEVLAGATQSDPDTRRRTPT